MPEVPKPRRQDSLFVNSPSRSSRWLPLLAVLAFAGCQQPAATPEGNLTVSPGAAIVAPGQRLQFTATSPWGSDVTWSVQPATEGTIDANGFFTASARPVEGSATCTVVATLRSDPTRVGLALVTIHLPTPVNMVAASGRVQTADGVEVESVLLEPVSSTTSRDATGETESRSGFYPSASSSHP